jgi:hypothetical protein
MKRIILVMISMVLTNGICVGHNNRFNKKMRELHDQFMEAIVSGKVAKSERIIKEGKELAINENIKRSSRYVAHLSSNWLVNRKNKKRDCYPIHAAVLTSAAMTKLLLNNFADQNMPSPSGQTALQFAIREHKHESMRSLLESKSSIFSSAKPNKKDRDGNNALHLLLIANADRDSFSTQDSELIVLLLQAGLNPLLKNKEGKLPSDCVRMHNKPLHNKSLLIEQLEKAEIEFETKLKEKGRLRKIEREPTEEERERAREMLECCLS